MATASKSKVSVNGSAAIADCKTPSRARKIAQGGLPGAADFVNLGRGLVCDVLDPDTELEDKKAALAIRAGNFTLRAAEFAHRNGNELTPTESKEERRLLARERELTAELEEIRERRSA